MNKFWCALLIMTISIQAKAIMYFTNDEVSNEPMSSAKVLFKRMISENTLEVGFKIDNPSNFNYKAGQFIKCYLDKKDSDLYKQDDRNPTYFRRSYSIASTPDEIKKDGTFIIAISLVNKGLASDWLTSCQPDDNLNFLGPMGKLILPEEKKHDRVVLLSTGTGLVPYLTFIPELRAEKSIKVEIIAGFRNPEQEIYRDIFQELNTEPHINYRVTYSQLKKDNQNINSGIDNSLHGYVQKHLPSLNLNPEKDRVYVCGGPAFLRDCCKKLESLGFENDVTYVKENYSFSGHIDKSFSISPTCQNN